MRRFRILRAVMIVMIIVCMAGTFFDMNVHAEPIDSEPVDTEPADDGASAVNEGSVKLKIDNQNIYNGMDKSYSDGYVPKVENGQALIVVPLICSGELKDNMISVALNLGDTQTMPFVCKNYEKNVPLQRANGEIKTDCYLVTFMLELNSERVNGSYPVVLTVKAADMSGNDIEQEFTTYVTVKDGKNPDSEPVVEPVTEEKPTFAPKVMVESYKYSKTPIEAGDDIKAEITLINTSEENAVKNMTVAVNAPTEYFVLKSKSDSVYVDYIGAGETYKVSFEYKVSSSAPWGQYNIDVTMDYADADGNTYSSTGKAKLDIEQPAEVKFDPLVISSELEVGDVTEARVQAMNLGRSKVYNVRAVIEADGLNPEGTIFIGDIDAGTVASGAINVSVSGLSGDLRYGETVGKVFFYYEDEVGNEITEEAEFKTVIKSPFSDSNNKEPEDEAGQWWIIMAVIGVIMLGFGVFFIYKRIKLRRQGDD